MISVVLATYNESQNLPNCLKAVAFADEIIVVDGQSTDDTVAVAKSFGARVISTTNKANFHINKQMAIDAAKFDLVLQLDADEIVDEQLTRFILKINTDPKFEHTKNAWWIKRKNYLLGRWLSKGGQYPDPVIRLLRRGKAKLPMKDVHEQMVVEGEIGSAQGHLLHYSNPTFSDYLRKFNTYTSFKATQLADAKIMLTPANSFRYLCWLPKITFLSLYIRHRGYVDGAAGFVFALMSGLHHAVSYLKLWEIKNYGNHTD